MTRAQKPKQNLMPVLAVVGLVLITVAVYGFIKKEKVPAPVQTYNEVVQDEVVQDNADVRQWAEGALPAILTFNYKAIPLAQQQQQKFFTEEGFKSFTEAMTNARIYEKMNANQQMSKLTVACPARILKSGVLGAQKIWTVGIPAELRYSAGQQSSSELAGYYLTVQETGDAQKEFAITQLIAVPLPDTMEPCARPLEPLSAN